jgi:hypothetical protein
MKLVRFIAIAELALIFLACGGQKESYHVINSGSFPEMNITLDGSVTQRLLSDSIVNIARQNQLSIKLDEMISLAETLRKNQSDSIWNTLSSNWYDLEKNGLSILLADSLSDSEASTMASNWANLNITLLKLSGEVKFGDAIEDLLYQFPRLVLTENQLKSIIYTHIDDQIYINIIGSSTLTHQHTTGGKIKLIQETAFPASNEMILKCESNDVRYLDVFIRIPEWAENPTVSHGNVKYVAHPGEYCQISRKWKDGDEIVVTLKN